MSADEQVTLDQLHADLLHLAGALRKRGPKYHGHAESMEWCAAQLAKVKEARNADAR